LPIRIHRPNAACGRQQVQRRAAMATVVAVCKDSARDVGKYGMQALLILGVMIEAGRNMWLGKNLSLVSGEVMRGKAAALFVAVAACALLGLAASPEPHWALAAETDASEAVAQVKTLLAQLDDDCYEVRQQAAAQCEALLARHELHHLLAEEFHHAAMRPEWSLEVHRRLRVWLRQLPQPNPAPQRATPEQLDRLIGQLDAPGAGARAAAEYCLLHLAADPQQAQAVLTAVKRRLTDPQIGIDAARQLEALWEQARRVILLGDSPHVAPPTVTDRQLQHWIEELAQPAAARSSREELLRRRNAQRELLDLLLCDSEVPRVRKALEDRLARAEPADAPDLRRLLELTLPALVAECWQGRRHVGEQHLLVGVPSQAENAAKPSHFDRIDDRTAHCVSGNNLEPGEYPVHVAFPHPKTESAFFHLVNLPNPRRRMAYKYLSQMDEALRLAEISRRTFQQILAEKRPLSEAELVMLAQLDPEELSRFAGPYFAAVDDSPLPPMGLIRQGGRPSRHAMICIYLAEEGTNTAVPGLLAAAQRGRFLPPKPDAPYRLHWVALLAIARRDPWPDCDAWLASQVANSELLVEDGRRTPIELGATAAALLLRRHGQPVGQYSLEAVEDPLLAQLGVEGFRFVTPEGRQQVQHWWQRHIQSLRLP